jgi:hypothetical protein
MRLGSRILLCCALVVSGAMARGGGGGGGRGGGGFGGGGFRGGGFAGGGFRGGGFVGGGWRGGSFGGFRGGTFGFGRFGFGFRGPRVIVGGWPWWGWGTGWGWGSPIGWGWSGWDSSYYDPSYAGYSSPYAGYADPYGGNAGFQTSPNVTVIYPPSQGFVPVPSGSAVIRQYDEYGQEVPPTTATAPPSSTAQAPIFLIAFNGTSVIYAAVAYWVDKGELHYVTLEHQERQAPLNTVNRSLTVQLNFERHVPFQLPAQ